MTVYSPYFNKSNGRYYIHSVDENGKQTTTTYARYLMEQHLGRTLEPWEHVDHINEDKTDDRLENLQILTNSENITKSNRFRNRKKWYEFTCPVCGKEARKEYCQYKHDQLVRGSDGPYCSGSCAAKARNRKRHTQPRTT